MSATKDADKSKSDVRELLLADYRSFSESLWKNEQTGETRVNWFIGIVTAAAGGLIGLTSAPHRPHGEPLRLIFVATLFALLSFGVVTLYRIVKRDRTTDGYKKDSDRIRQMFREHFDDAEILQNYHPFGKKSGETSQPRKLGRLAHTVSNINALLIAGLVGAVSFPFGDPSTFKTDVLRRLLIYVSVPMAFVVAWVWQFNWLNAKGPQPNPTHAGGIVFHCADGEVKYLLVGPKKRVTKEGTNEVVEESILPKGHIETGEEHWETALREVREETGVIGRPVCAVGSDEFKVGAQTVKVKYYLIERISSEEVAEEERDRLPRWFDLENSLESLTHPSNRGLLVHAEHLRLGQANRKSSKSN